MDPEKLKKYSSATTLSDMEVFVFPELMYSLVLANIMSPVIWKWRDLDCFQKLEGKSSYRKLMRLKQFIMDEYEFNLDLETWGLTDKNRELRRFEKFISPDDISRSNALFGYHGDQYYFDVDIRRHFGLDKYNTDIIPYWKTETVEAMDAFRLKKGYRSGAGECVSLSALYAAAAFIVCGIPLEDIFMILTPLHSQNFIDLKDGILTNNRRLVTKTMWFNGTAISNKAQRALRNERVTIIAHCTGYVHCFYNDATIDIHSYERLNEKLGSYLTADLNMEVFASFLRCHREYQEYFQICRDCHGQSQYLKAEILFHYEHSSNHKIGCRSQDKLMYEVSDEDFLPYPLAERVRCDELEDFLTKQKPNLQEAKDRQAFIRFVKPLIPQAEQFVAQFADFLYTETKLPTFDKVFHQSEPISLDKKQDRRQIVEYLQKMREINTTADLAFYAYRDMVTCDWQPFVKAALERNPVSLEMTKSMSIDNAYQWLTSLRSDSIYTEKRAAQPDEVANYGIGDGFEKALCLANIMHNRDLQQEIQVIADGNKITVKSDKEYVFSSDKDFQKQIIISPSGKYLIKAE